MRTYLRSVAVLLPLAIFMLPTSAAAQWRYPPIFYPPYPGYHYGPPESSLRINMTPKDASVYVDGYFAGKVDDFDGRLQRLHVLPGEHEITVYLEGYRSLTEHLYLSPNSTRTLDGALERLAPGEAQEPQPTPTDRDREGFGPPDDEYPAPPPGPVTRGRPTAPPPPPRRAPRSAPDERSRFASLSIRVQPAGATIRIDGERWDGPSGDERLIVQVTEGRHTIEVEREGYERFTTEIDIRRGETTPININLRRR